MISGDVWEAFEAAELVKHGSWPNAGGWLDQPRILLDAISSIRVNEAHFKAPHTFDQDDEWET